MVDLLSSRCLNRWATAAHLLNMVEVTRTLLPLSKVTTQAMSLRTTISRCRILNRIINRQFASPLNSNMSGELISFPHLAIKRLLNSVEMDNTLSSNNRTSTRHLRCQSRLTTVTILNITRTLPRNIRTFRCTPDRRVTRPECTRT